MDTHINIQPQSVKYKVDQSIGLIHCKKSVTLWIFGEEKRFCGEGYSHCTKENIFNESFGKALAWIRASHDIGRQIETSLVKYSFEHFVNGEITNHRAEMLIEEITKLLRRNKIEKE